MSGNHSSSHSTYIPQCLTMMSPSTSAPRAHLPSSPSPTPPRDPLIRILLVLCLILLLELAQLLLVVLPLLNPSSLGTESAPMSLLLSSQNSTSSASQSASTTYAMVSCQNPSGTPDSSTSSMPQQLGDISSMEQTLTPLSTTTTDGAELSEGLTLP